MCPWANRASWAEVCGVLREANAPTGGARESERLQYPEGVGLHGLCGAADGDRAQRACGLVVAAAGLTVVVDILGNGVVGRPAGASVRCDGGRGDPPFDDHEGTVTAVAPAVDALGSVNVDQTSLRIGAFRRGPSPWAYNWAASVSNASTQRQLSGGSALRCRPPGADSGHRHGGGDVRPEPFERGTCFVFTTATATT